MSNLPRNPMPDFFVDELGELLRTSLRDRVQKTDRHILIGFGEYLLAARTMLKLSRCDFARLTDTTEAHIHALEEGLLPRAAISEHLLQRISTVLEEDREILAIILGDIVVPPPTSSVAAMLPWRSAMVGADRLRRFGAWIRQHQTIYWSGNLLLQYAIPWTTLLYSRYRNLLDRLQASRLITSIALNPMALMTVACCCIVLWLGVSMDHRFRSVTRQGVTAISADNAHIGSTRIIQPATASPALRLSHSQPPVTPASVDRALQPNVTVVSDAYRIIYMHRSATRQLATAAYIVVNEEQLAMIEFRANGTSHWRCTNSGRFDLCPI